MNYGENEWADDQARVYRGEVLDIFDHEERRYAVMDWKLSLAISWHSSDWVRY